MIPEINLKLKTIEVKGGTTIKLTVRNIFYQGIIGKIRTLVTWLRYHRHKTLKEYLNSPVTYKVEMSDIHCYHDINAEAELTAMLQQDVKDGKLKYDRNTTT